MRPNDGRPARVLSLTAEALAKLRLKAQVLTGCSAPEAAAKLRIGIRQVFRLRAKLKQGDVTALLHGNRGRAPANVLPVARRRRIVELFQAKYYDFNVAHFTQMLAENEHVCECVETVRRVLRAAGQLPPPRGRKVHRRKRTRKARFGTMLFLDGSPHHWLGTDRPPLTLILATDDATGRPLRGVFLPQETLNGCFEVLYHVLRRFGLPGTLYLDRAGQFVTTRHGGTHRFQDDRKPTAFQIAMHALGIQVIFADSPQARGRGERMNRSFQGRLVAELRLHEIHDAVRATAYLNETFIPRYVRDFGVEPRECASAFRPVPAGLELRNVLCVRQERTVRNDNTIQLGRRVIQLLPTRGSCCIAQSRVEVRAWFDGSIHVRHPRIGEVPLAPSPAATGRAEPARGG